MDNFLRIARLVARLTGGLTHPKFVSVVLAIVVGVACYRFLLYLRDEPGEVLANKPTHSTGAATATGTGTIANTGNSATINNATPPSKGERSSTAH